MVCKSYIRASSLVVGQVMKKDWCLGGVLFRYKDIGVIWLKSISSFLSALNPSREVQGPKEKRKKKKKENKTKNKTIKKHHT